MIKNFIKKKINSIKICAVFTAVCFLVSTLGANLYAIPVAENANQKYEDVFNKASSISAEYGKITSSRDGNSDITIINIQDLHCHPQTQRNISKIIAQIAEKYNLKEIYVEGGYGNIDLNWLTSIKDENIRKQVTEKLLEEGLLTGSEYYKLTSGNKDVELKGIDEEKLHRENVKRLAWIIENQDKYKDVIKKVENEINILEKIYVNNRNERFNRDIEKYLTNEIDSRRFYRQLVKYVKDINENPDKYNNITAIRLEDYPNITKFIALRKTSQKIDVKEVTQQLQMVINELKSKLPYNVYMRLLNETENLSDSQKVVELITMLCDKEGINLENKYRSLKTFLESNEINRELNTVELVYEERQLLKEIRKALSYNNEEYEITFVSDFSRFFKDYLEYKLTDADWKYFESGYEQFRQLYAKYATVDRIEELEEDFVELNKYYGINDIRNEVFVNNLLQNKHPDVIEQSKFREDEEILKGSKEVIIAVTGGFHSNALEDILQAKEVNTIVITPSIFEGIEKATKQYKGIIKEQSKEFQHQALAYRILSSLEGQEQRVYLYGALKSLLGDNLNKLKEVLGEDVDLDSLEKELQNLQLSSDEQSQLKVNRTVQFLESVADALINEPLFPKEGCKAIFVPNVNERILKVSETLVDAGIFLSNGPIFAAEQQGLPYLKEIAPEIYSRMPAFIQEALVATEGFVVEESVVEKETGEDIFEKEETVIDDEESDSDSDYLSDEKKAELLERLNNNEKTVVDTDLRLAAFENFIDYFYSEEDESEYIRLFEKLFSLQPEILSFVNEKMDGASITDLLYDYEAEIINKNLTDLLARYGKELSKLKEFSRIVLLFENIEKLNSLSELDFDYFMGLSNQFFVYVWAKSENSSQLKTKLEIGRRYCHKGCDKDLAKAYFANAEKLQGLKLSLYYVPFTRLNKEALIYVLNNAKSTSNIETILTFYHGMGLSPTFDSQNIKDFEDSRFKALVKYISFTEDRDFYDKLFFGDYNKKELGIIADSIDDGNFIKDYILNPEYKDIYTKLFKSLASLDIKNVAAENNYLALKLILNEDFNRILSESEIENISDEDNIVARYHSAIAVSRLMYDGAEEEFVNYDFDDEKFIELMKEVTNTYIEIMREMFKIVLIDSNTKIYALCNTERLRGRDRFNIDTLQQVINYMGIPLIIPQENIYRRIGNNTKASAGWLQAIEEFQMDSEETKGYFVFSGHGAEQALMVYDPEVKNGLAFGSEKEQITPQQLADSLFKLATRANDPVDLRNITIDLSCCNSYFFARNVYDLLEQKFKAENKTESYPAIITAAGFETALGYTDLRSMESNLYKGINELIRNFPRNTVPALSLGMIGMSEYMFRLSNITMFTSFFNETTLEKIAKVREAVKNFTVTKYNESRYANVEGKPDVSDTIEQVTTSVSTRNLRKRILKFLPGHVTEVSISGRDKTAPIWEELVYRAIPAMAFSGVILALTMLFPAIPAIGVVAKLVSVGVFAFIQTKFIKAHIVTDWLEAMDAGGPILKDILENKDLSFKEKLSKATERIKERLFVIFPDSTAERSFYRYYTINRQAITHREGLIIPTIVFAVPYIAAIVFFNSMPAIAVATVLSMVIHYINNLIARTIEEKEKLEAQHLSGEFLDIQKRLRHVELIVENPQMKNDLTEIKVGPLALTFGLERQKERRDKSLTEFRNIIDTLKQNIETELSKIDKKKRKTKKDKERIAELKEELELIQKEYPTIITETGEEVVDTTKIEGTINKINKLLAVFEEIENILNAIETFRNNNGNSEETRELEREFLDFTERTLMRELMSLYDEKVTGVHVRRVVSFAKFIGMNMPFGNDVRMMYKLMLSSVLHDIGKNLVPESILNKQGTFNDFERDIMEFHVVFGGLILRSSILKRLSYTAENHHYTNNSPRSYSFKTKMDRMFGSSDYEYNEEEAQIAKIVTLADVFEAVSPKLSFDSERTYQFSKKIRDISDMLENIEEDIELTESQKKEVIILLAEIAQIDAEEDAEQKRAMEQDFIRKVLYAHSRSVVINYIREKNNELIRSNAFRVIFTESPQFIFTKLGKTEAEFMSDFRKNPKGTVDKCMSLIDVSKLEFDADVVRAFLEFYFSAEDININNAIIESLNREKESALVVYIKDVSYSIYKFFRRIRYTLIRFAPVIASISSSSSSAEQEEGISVKEKFNIDADIIGHDVVVKKKNGEVYFLHFTDTSFKQIGRKYTGVTMSPSSYGIKEIKRDENGKIIDIILYPGAEIDSDTSETKSIEGSETENLSFADIEEQIKENYERKHQQKLGQEGFLLKPIMEDTGTTEKIDIYLDDDVKTILAAIEDAIDNNKLMVIHVFKKGIKTQNLSLWQRYKKYKEVYSLLDSRSKFESTFSKSSTVEKQYIKQVEDGLTDEEKKDLEWTKRNTATTYFALREILKNNFDHGNLGLFEYPIALHISKDNNGRVTAFSTYNLSTKPISLDRAEEESFSDLMYEAYISGSHKGTEYMTDSFFTNLEYGDDIKISVGEENYRIYRTKVTLKTEQEQEQALEKYNQYRQQKAEERRKYEEASAEKKKELEEQKKKADLAAFWDDFFSILKPLGWKLGEYPHIWEEGVFRYLATALILSGYMSPLIGLGIQVVFILAHPIVKWIAARENGKKVGIGDLFKQIGKDFVHLGLPTFAMMLPYAGTLFTFAINPALSIIITPVFFMFADVIVQWLTRKDSGGKININANSVIALAIASLAGYAVLPFIPVIHPLVNALINPIVITNFFGAGRLHYEYNKRQQDQNKLLNIIDFRERTRNYLEGIKIDGSIKKRIQRLCNDKEIDLSQNEFLQELLFTKGLCFFKESLLSILFEIKFDGENSELKKEILTRYLTENGYSVSDESEFYLLKELINYDDNEIILNYLLNHSVKEFLEYLYLSGIENFSEQNKDFLNKIKEVISSTDGKISIENLFHVAKEYDTYKQNIDKFADKADKNYSLKCAILAKYIGVDFNSQSNVDKVEWLFATNHKGFLTYILYGVDLDSIILEDFLIDKNGNNIYEDNDFDILNKYLQELERVLPLGNNSDNIFSMLFDILDKDNIKKTRKLDTETFKAFLTLGISNYFLLSQIIKKAENDEELKNYLDFINEKANYIKDKKIPIAEIIEKINSARELKKYFNLVEEYNLIFDIAGTDEKGDKKYSDYRWKIALEYLNIEENFRGEIFKYLLTQQDSNGYKYELFKNFPKDSSFFQKMFYGTTENRNKYISLFNSLIELKFKGIASDNDFLALRLLVDKNFVSKLGGTVLNENMSESEKLVATYHAAIAVSRFIYDSVGSEISGYDLISSELSSERIKKQIGVITDLYIEAIKQMGQIVLIDSHTKIYGLLNDEIRDRKERFNEEAILKMLEILGIADKMDSQPVFYKRNDRHYGSNAGESWLDAIEELTLETTPEKQERAYFVFRGHGNHIDSGNPETDDYLVVKNKENNVEAEKIYAKDVAERLFKLATRQENPVDLRRVTIDLSCCNSYFFARSVYKYLKQMYEDYAKSHKDFEGTYPTIITAAGLETKSGHSIPSSESKNEGITQWIGNLHEGIVKVLNGKTEFTLDTLALSEYQFRLSNITMFPSFDDNMAEQIEKVRKTTLDVFREYSVGTQTDKNEPQLIQEGEEGHETAETKRGVAVPTLFGGLFEASILKPLGLKKDDHPYVWEEIIFRHLPTALILSHVINPIVGIGIQLLFISAHSIVKWSVAKKTAKEKGEKEVGISDLFKQVGKDIKNLGLPTLAMMLPYAGTLLSFAINPALSMLITPVFFMFADVIVQWITRKDSGGKITINKNLVVFAAISSLLAYTLLPVIPVINPLVNALINPILAVNTAGAGYLHYEYNKGQQDRDKKLTIGVDEEDLEDEEEDIDVSDQSIRAKNRIYNAGQPFDIKKFLGKRTIEVITRGGSKRIVDFGPEYRIPVGYDENYRIKNPSGYFSYEQNPEYHFEYKLSAGCFIRIRDKDISIEAIHYVRGVGVKYISNGKEYALVDGEYILSKKGKTNLLFRVERGQIRTEQVIDAKVARTNWLASRFASKQKSIMSSSGEIFRYGINEGYCLYDSDDREIDAKIIRYVPGVKVEFEDDEGNIREIKGGSYVLRKKDDIESAGVYFRVGKNGLIVKEEKAKEKIWLQDFAAETRMFARCSIEAAEGYELVNSSDRSFDIESLDDVGKTVTIKNKGTGEEITIVFGYNNEDSIIEPKTSLFYGRDSVDRYKRPISRGFKEIKDKDGKIVDVVEELDSAGIDEQLRNYGITKIVYHYTTPTIEMFFDGETKPKTISFGSENTASLYYKGRIFYFDRQHFAPIKVYKVNDDVFDKVGGETDPLKFEFKSDISHVEIVRGFRVEDFGDKYFVITREGKDNVMLYFDSKRQRLYEVNNYFDKVEISKNELKKYGILEFSAKNGKIAGLILEEGAGMQIDVRQPMMIGVSEEEIQRRIEAKMDQFAQSIQNGERGPLVFLAPNISTIPRAFLETKLKEDFPEIVRAINAMGKRSVSTEELETVLKSFDYVLEEDVRMFIEGILNEYILENTSKIVATLSPEIKLDILSSVCSDEDLVQQIHKLQKTITGVETIESKKKFLKDNFGLKLEGQELSDFIITEDNIIEKLIEQNIIQISAPYQLKQILLRAGLTEEQITRINFNSTHPLQSADQDIKMTLAANNYQFKEILENLGDIDFLDEEKLEQILRINPFMYAMFIETIVRTFDALKLQGLIGPEFEIDENSTLEELTQTLGRAIDGKKITKDDLEKLLRGYFGEVYCTKAISVGVVDGITLRFQMPEDSNEPGIDLIDPISGLKIQVKTGEGYIVKKHLDKNWKTKDQDNFFKFGPKMIPVLTVQSVKDEIFSDNSNVQGFGINAGTVTGWIKYLLDYGDDDSVQRLDKNRIRKKMESNFRIMGVHFLLNKKLADIIKDLEAKQVAILEGTESPSKSGIAILPENMGLVNRILQSKFGNAFIAATVIAFKEFRASLEPSFVDLHQTAAGRLGAQQVADLANRYKITNNDTLVTKIVKSILGIMFKGASIVKHIAIDYRYIKASGIQEAINMFGSKTYMDEYGQIHIPPVLIVNDLQEYKGNLNPTGIKVNGRYIYQIKESGILIYGAQGIDSKEISTAVNESQFIKEAVESMLREKGYEDISVEVEGVIQEEGTGVRFENGITIIGTQELQNKTAEYVDGYVTSSVEIKRAVGMMYSQKALISLESIEDIEKLKQALTQGRARKIISKNQYDMLQLTEEEIIAMRKNGIEIYIDSNEIDESLKENGITGQIIRRGEQISVYDYYTQEEQAVEEVGEDKSLTDIENLLVNSQKPILIDIKVLAKKFQRENILGAYNGLNTLIGNIKLKTGIGELNKTDIKSLGYNLDYNKLPELSLSKPLQKYSKEEIENMLNTSILSAEPNSEIGIILKALGTKEELKQEFIQIMKERILAKTALKQNYKEFGLKDKNLEILLGQMLFKQLDFALEDKNPEDLNNIDVTYINKEGKVVEVSGEKEGFMEKITQDMKKIQDMEQQNKVDSVAINSIIDIILTYGDEYKEKQIARDMDKNDLRNYRAMMAAA